MIRKLRRKLIFVLMAILSLLIIVILVSLFFTARMNYERRSIKAFSDPPPAPDTFDNSVLLAMPVASVIMDSSGHYSVYQNRIRYVSDEELIEIAASLKSMPNGSGLASEYNLRYRQYPKPDGSVVYFFSDTYIERDSLKGQILYSVIIGVVALGLFFAVTLLLSRWMVKPVERAWERQRRFVTDASHELKTPLTVILSNTEMLIESGVVTDEQNRIRLDNIRAESKRMKALTENLLELARPLGRQKTTIHEPVDLSYVLSAAALMFEPTVYDLGRSIQSEIQESISVSGNRDKLRQVVDILIDNAIQYGDDKSPVTIRLSVINKREALLSIISEGTPLSDTDCTHIFERFYRVDASRGLTKGFGLGLSIAKSIVKEHGGTIWAESDGRKLNMFFVKLPCRIAAQKAVSSAENTAGYGT